MRSSSNAKEYESKTMSTQFTDREKGFEAKSKMEQENTFKVETHGIDFLGYGSRKSSDCRQPSIKHMPTMLLWLICRNKGSRISCEK